jgi:hypothetical protein
VIVDVKWSLKWIKVQSWSDSQTRPCVQDNNGAEHSCDYRTAACFQVQENWVGRNDHWSDEATCDKIRSLNPNMEHGCPQPNNLIKILWFLRRFWQFHTWQKERILFVYFWFLSSEFFGLEIEIVYLIHPTQKTWIIIKVTFVSSFETETIKVPNQSSPYHSMNWP